jgi:hypothetical protein
MTDRVVLTNKKTGQKLPEATLRNRTPSWVYIQFDGAEECNGFRVSEWDIEDVKPPLPTEPGWYSLGDFGNVAFLSASGNWYVHGKCTLWQRDPEFIARYITGRMVEVPFDE